MIDLQHVSYHYTPKREVIKGLTTQIRNGISLLLGPNSSGKTTLMHIMEGLRFPKSGTCKLDGVDLSLRRPSEMQRVQYYACNMKLPASNLREMVKIHSVFFPNFDAATLDYILGLFGIGLNDKLKNMSFGTYIKACIAYMIALHCDVLLLDEPTIGLDIKSKEILNSVLVNCIDENQTAVISTNSPAEIKPVYDNLMVLKEGCLLLNMSLEEITQRLAFVTATSPDAGCLYSEPYLGKYRCIIARCNSSIESNVDVALLYNALVSDNNQAFLNTIHYDNV